jgi:membrane associated rhomboid family serine protease
MKHRLTRSFRQLGGASQTWILFLIIIVFQTIPFAYDKLSESQIILGLNRHELFNGKIWQLITYVFIHGNWTHLSFNALAILLLSTKLEHIISKVTYWRLCLYATLAGALMFLLLSPCNQTLVGSSPLCFAFLLMLTTLSPDSKFLPIFLSGKTLGIAIILANLLLATLNPNLPTGPIAKLGQEIANRVPNLFDASHACHLGGSLVGWIYGIYMLRPRVSLKTLQQRRKR